MTTSTEDLIARPRRVDAATRFALRCALGALVIGAIPVIGVLGIFVAQSGAIVALVGVILAVVYEDGLLEPFCGFWACHLAVIGIGVWQMLFFTWEGVHLVGRFAH